MSPILGNAIALFAVGVLVAACVRRLRHDAKQGGCSGCHGCAGCGNACSRCAGKKKGVSPLR